MCGRKYNLPTLDWQTYRDLFVLDVSAPPSNFPPNYNITPTHDVPVVAMKDGKQALQTMRWGLLPFGRRTRRSTIGWSMLALKPWKRSGRSRLHSMQDGASFRLVASMNGSARARPISKPMRSSVWIRSRFCLRGSGPVTSRSK